MQSVAPVAVLGGRAQGRAQDGNLRKAVAVASCVALLCLIATSSSDKNARDALLEGRQQTHPSSSQLAASHGVLDASAMFASSPKLALPATILKDATQAARGGDARDRSAMAAAMQFRKASGAGKMQNTKGHALVRTSTQPVAGKRYGLGIASVASMGETALAKQLAEENESRTQSMLPEHEAAAKPIGTQAQIADSEIASNDREADGLLPEHNLEAPHKSLLKIQGSEVKYNKAHAIAVMPKSQAPKGVVPLSRANQAQSEEAAYAKRADAIVPEHTPDKKKRTQAQIRDSEERYNAKHADAIMPEHSKEKARQTRSQIREREERYNEEQAAKVVPEQAKESTLHRTQAQIRASEEQDNAVHAGAVVPQPTAITTSQRLSVAQQAAREEHQMEEGASNVVVTDNTIDRDIRAAREQGARKQHEFEAARRRELHDESRSSYSYDKLYDAALKKEERRHNAGEAEVQAQDKIQEHMNSQIDMIEGKDIKPLSAHAKRQRKIEEENDRHITSQVDAITAASAGPRDASHMETDASRNQMAMQAISKHLNREVAHITSPLSESTAKTAVPRQAATTVARKSVKGESTAAKTAKMLAAEHKMDKARNKKLFNVYSQTTTSSTRPKVRHESWAAQVWNRWCAPVSPSNLRSDTSSSM